MTVVIDEGSSASVFADKLFDAGVIDSRSAFSQELKAKGADSKLKPGTYRFEGGMSVSAVVDSLVSGPNASSSLVVPEGATMKS
ncbi:MAG: endolytic transglycosylase MltG, partial [Coriobacteriia bacterium]|nr:endolytic transglycosylase MltG [Coriobacteriia bacterium]